MKIKFLLTLFFLTILSLIISYGCGGGNDVITQPSSITTPTVNPLGYGYLVVEVVWPQNDSVSDKCIISSGNKDNELIASMPDGVMYVVVKVREENALEESVMTTGDGKEAKATINWNLGEDRAVIGPLPAVKVNVRAEAWGIWRSGAFKMFHVDTKEPVQIKPGMQPVDLDLGKEGFTLKAIPPDITLQPVITSNSIVNIGPLPTPTPVISYSGETEIIARLVVESPDIPDATPTTFTGKENSNSNNTLESQGVMGLENFEVNNHRPCRWL
jgi:hypothetical protein